MRLSAIVTFLAMMAPTVVVAGVAVFTLVAQPVPAAPAGAAAQGPAAYAVVACAAP